MIEALENLDRSIFLALNGAHNSFWDVVMFWASNKWVWMPFYVVLFIIVYIQFRRRTGLILLLAAGLVVCTDQSANLFKNKLVQRYRPCHNYELKEVIHLNGECGGKFGFVSSHASNTFGMAAFLLLLLRFKSAFAWVLILLWAALVSYSRIYNGVHYPADILGGALIGILMGVLCYRLTKKLELKIFKT
ncbi:MAG: phosphatase PAP2 family protein [Bacteroidia bacterium]|nr:phosphatase PAP2 family protein [Bacteroidia bacterium]